jgi:hypothetical protein
MPTAPGAFRIRRLNAVKPDGGPHSGRSHMEHMRQIAQYEIDSVPADSPTAAVSYVVLGTVLIEPPILALRRLAQAEASARRFG